MAFRVPLNIDKRLIWLIEFFRSSSYEQDLKNGLRIFPLLAIVTLFSIDYHDSWQAPKQSELKVLRGEFYPKSACERNRNPLYITSYKFKAESGQEYLIDCEPYPPVNNCMMSDKSLDFSDCDHIDNTAFSGKPVEIGISPNDNVILSLNMGGVSMLNYETRVSEIKQSVLSSAGRFSHAVERSPKTPLFQFILDLTIKVGLYFVTILFFLLPIVVKLFLEKQRIVKMELSRNNISLDFGNLQKKLTASHNPNW